MEMCDDEGSMRVWWSNCNYRSTGMVYCILSLSAHLYRSRTRTGPYNPSDQVSTASGRYPSITPCRRLCLNAGAFEVVLQQLWILTRDRNTRTPRSSAGHYTMMLNQYRAPSIRVGCSVVGCYSDAGEFTKEMSLHVR
jgi:hypothetical protein